MTGTVYLVPNLLGAVPPSHALPQRTIDVARSLVHWIVETPKPARAFLKALEVVTPIANLDLRTFPTSTTAANLSTLLTPAREGHDIGLLTDAGCPGVADPGAAVVAAAHGAGIRIVPLVGPSAVLLALMASGMNGQSFAFHGYLPVKPDARTQALRALEADSRTHRRAELFIETPYRNIALLEAISQTLKSTTLLCVAADLTLPSETIERRTAAAWRDHDIGRFAKRPALFVMQA
ncbi:MAG TPA: SAM-dependent methyltransferase [Casimicrobiaceae bacterium]|nr:SAM-dependent methyltransferase [Casimicrobiaceae bacterium]